MKYHSYSWVIPPKKLVLIHSATDEVTSLSRGQKSTVIQWAFNKQRAQSKYKYLITKLWYLDWYKSAMSSTKLIDNALNSAAHIEALILALAIANDVKGSMPNNGC